MKSQESLGWITLGILLTILVLGLLTLVIPVNQTKNYYKGSEDGFDWALEKYGEVVYEEMPFKIADIKLCEKDICSELGIYRIYGEYDTLKIDRLQAEYTLELLDTKQEKGEK